MSQKIQTTVHDLSSANQCCPHCGRAYTHVDYYTGRKISSSSTQVTSSLVRTQSIYQNVQYHRGGICRYCDAENQRRTLKKMILIGAAGLVLCIIGVLIIIGIIAVDRMKYGGVEILLITIGGTAFLVGMIAAMVMAMMNPNSAINYISLYTMFVDRLGKEGKKRSDVEYLTEQQGKEMRPVR